MPKLILAKTLLQKFTHLDHSYLKYDLVENVSKGINFFKIYNGIYKYWTKLLKCIMQCTN